MAGVLAEWLEEEIHMQLVLARSWQQNKVAPSQTVPGSDCDSDYGRLYVDNGSSVHIFDERLSGQNSTLQIIKACMSGLRRRAESLTPPSRPLLSFGLTAPCSSKRSSRPSADATSPRATAAETSLPLTRSLPYESTPSSSQHTVPREIS